MRNFNLCQLNDQKGDLKKRWYVWYHCTDPATGKNTRFKIYISSRIRNKTARREEARSIIQETNKKLLMGWSPFMNEDCPKVENIITVITKILKVKSKSLWARSRQTYQSRLNIFMNWLQATGRDKICISEFSVKMAREYMDHVLIDRNVKNRTYNNYLMDMRTIFNELQRREYIYSNPFSLIKTLERETVIKNFNAAELVLINEELQKHVFLFRFCMFIYYTLLRPIELTRLKVKDVYLLENVIIPGGDISKNRKTKCIDIVQPLQPIVEEMNLQQYPSEYYLFSDNLKPGKKYIWPQRVHDIWRKKIKDVLGISSGIYTFKNLAIFRLCNSGVPMPEVAQHARHHSVSYTQIYYEAFAPRTSDKFKKSYPDF